MLKSVFKIQNKASFCLHQSFSRRLLGSIAAMTALLSLTSCVPESSVKNPQDTPTPTVVNSATPSASPISQPQPSVKSVEVDLASLEQSWAAYRTRFIQKDGRVIDREASDRTTSEAQAYAMLRAVLINDPKTFAKTLEWSENNLQRKVGNKPSDRLWIWKWGKDQKGKWGAIDPNFASDADIDAITALILASRRWNRPEYLKLAQAKLQDLWNLSTVATPKGDRYLLPGPKEAFQISPEIIQLNPSYLSPYAFRIFAQVDPNHNWLSLVDSSYQILENSALLSTVGLPSDWVLLDTKTGEFQTLPNSSPQQTEYSFDAYRVWWRISLDAAWFKEPLATKFMKSSLKHLISSWRKDGKIYAKIDRQGNPLVDYEATSQYAMLYSAMRLIEPDIAEEIWQRKLLPQYKNGFWDNDSAYYTQNLVWLGILPQSTIASGLLSN